MMTMQSLSTRKRLCSWRGRQSMIGRLLLGALIGWGCGIIVQPAFAFKLTPMVMEFDPAGRGATQTFEVENDSTDTIAIQISMMSRTIDPDGKEKTADAENDFSVYPPQFLLPGRQTQTVRVKWLGNTAPQQELPYRIVAEQLPVNMTKEQQTGNRINLLLRYMGSVYIVPKGATPQVKIETLEPAVLTNGAPGLALTFYNSGTKHAVLRDLKVQLRAGGRAVEAGTNELAGIAGENMLAGHRRRVVMPRPAALPGGPVTAEFQFLQRK